MSNEPQQLLGPLSQSLLRDFWRDRTGNWSLPTIRKFVAGMSKPPWWRIFARRRWRKMARNMCKPQPGLRNWLRVATGEEIEAEYLKRRAAK